ncbi:MAG TPA: nucleotidyltransferase domain-containing protein [Gaiellaceae bacterium]|nr:nucleotidyltransferase domain-containing protein [Gaiellaceae bacterium]
MAAADPDRGGAAREARRAAEPGQLIAPETARTRELRELAERIAAGLPPVVEEVVLTGSVSRGVADEVSDIEMLVVTAERLGLDECFEHARGVGLSGLDTWGVRGTSTSRVFGYLDGVPVELVWWPRDHAEASVDALLRGESSSAAEALANGVALRTAGLLRAWQARLRVYPDELAAARIEEAALTWGGYAPAGMLTITRPGERLALVERILDDVLRVLRIVYALNRAWEPTTKRLAARVEELPVKPERLAGRIEDALTEPDPLRAALVLSELQADTLALAPSGPNVDRARLSVAEVLEVLREAAARS